MNNHDISVRTINHIDVVCALVEESRPLPNLITADVFYLFHRLEAPDLIRERSNLS